MYTSVFCEPTCERCNYKKSCIRYRYAERLYNAGYRKGNKETHCWKCIESKRATKEDIRKETAKELLNKFRGLLIDISFAYMFSKDTSVVGVALDECVGELNEMFKQYNVEVEE